MKIEFTGLTEKEVSQRIEAGQTNYLQNTNSRTVADILRENIFTRFNFLLIGLSIVILIAGGGILNMLAITGVVFNSAIGIFQELSAKKTLDEITILNTTKIEVLRAGQVQEIPIFEVVLDDCIYLKLGDQIVADGVILASQELEIDESLLTGESLAIVKSAEDKVLSGSIVIAGSAWMRAEKVGADSYSAKLTSETKQFTRVNSEIQNSINKILTWISWSLLVIMPVLIIGQLQIRGSWQSSTLRAMAAIIAMVPNGLVVLASMAFMIAAVKLSQKKVLVQRMPAVETLARVDSLLLDKTGTITEDVIKFDSLILEDETKRPEIEAVLKTISSRNSTPTNEAIAEALENSQFLEFSQEIPFSSVRKFSAISIKGKNYIFGAPEILYQDERFAQQLKQAQDISAEGKRVLVLAENSEIFSESDLSDLSSIFKNNQPLALVALSEKIRETAAETLSYFAEENVDIKIVSGDSPVTVAAIAKRVKLENIRVFDARELPEIDLDFKEKLTEKSRQKFKENMTDKEKAFAQIVQEHNVFGRVRPEQKRQIARILQLMGRTVAMTGDGVNDALALKMSDLGIAMESGSAASKSVAEIVLLDNDFSHLPEVLAEGRRVIANIERVANLFIVKNVFVLVVSLVSTFLGLLHPYLPIQMSVIDILAIGLPAFFLALAPNKRLYKLGFLRRILQFAIPVGLVVGISIMAGYFLFHREHYSLTVSGTAVSTITMMTLLAVLIVLSRPFAWWKIAIIVGSAAGFLLSILTPLRLIFKYQLEAGIVPQMLLVGFLGMVLVFAVDILNRKLLKNE